MYKVSRSNRSSNQVVTGDLIVGARDIALFLWGDASLKRRVYLYLETPGRIPVRRDPWTSKLVASKLELAKWREEVEARTSPK